MKPTQCPHCGSLTYDYAGLVIESLSDGRVRCGDATITLPRRETLVLRALLEAKGRSVTTDAMYAAVYGTPVDGGPDIGALWSHISKVRTKLRKIGAGVTIFHTRFSGTYSLRPDIDMVGIIRAPRQPAEAMQ